VTKKTDMLIYREARVERRFDRRPCCYNISIRGISGLRTIVVPAGVTLELGQKLEVSWFPKGRTWIARGY